MLLGWIIIGECCFDKIYILYVVINKIYILLLGRSLIFLFCLVYMKVLEVRNNLYDILNEEIIIFDIFVRIFDDD